MLIRLTLVTTAAIIGGMMYFGDGDGGVPVEDVAEKVLTPAPEPERAPEPETATVAAAPDEAAPEETEFLAAETAAPEPEQPAPGVEVARRDGAEANGVLPASIQVDAAVAAALDEPPEMPVSPEAPVQQAAAAEPEPQMVYVTGSRVNLRAGPSTGDTVVGRLARGTEAEVLGEAPDGWLRIRDLATGTEGYMSGDFLSPVNPG